MNTQPTPQNIQAVSAIVIHQMVKGQLNLCSGDQGYSSSSGLTSNESVMTVHPIIQSNKGPVMGVGKPITDVDRELIAQALLSIDGVPDSPATANVEWSAYMRHQSSTYQLWYVPPAKRKMYFKGIAAKNQNALDLWWPGLIFFYHADLGFRIFAYAGRGRPKKHQRLYHAPLWNVYCDGRLCLGTAVGNNSLNAEGRKAWEDAIFESNFTHSNHDQVIPNKKEGKNDKGYMHLIKQKAKDGARFMAKEMVKHPQYATLLDFIEAVERTQHGNR